METGILTQDELKTVEKFHYLIDRNMDRYDMWWIKDRPGMCCDVSEELHAKVREMTLGISPKGALVPGYYGMTIFHQLIDHNYYEEVEMLLQKGVDPNARCGEGKGDFKESYKGLTGLHLACYQGNYKMVQLLLKYGADSTLCDDIGRNCYHFLARNHYERTYNRSSSSDGDAIRQRINIFYLLEGDINKQTVDGRSPLMELVQSERNHSVYLIKPYLEKGANPALTDVKGNTALIYAAINNNVTATGELVSYKETLDIQNLDGETAFHQTYKNFAYAPAVAFWLKEAGADDSIRNHEGFVVMDYLESRNGYENEKKVLRNAVRTVKDYMNLFPDLTRDWWGGEYDDYNTFAYMLARKILRMVDRDDDDEMLCVIKLLEKLLYWRNGYLAVGLLLEEGYDLEEKVYEGRHVTTLRDICIERTAHEESVMIALCEHGIDIQGSVVEGKTLAILLASGLSKDSHEKRHEEAVRCCEYMSKESMEEYDNEGMAAVHYAAKDSHLLLQKMIEKGVDISLTTDYPATAGNTPLHIACIYHNVEAVRVLMEAGADDTILNAEGLSPAHCLFEEDLWFETKTCDAILDLLKNVDIPNGTNGQTPFMRLLGKNAGQTTQLAEKFMEKNVDVCRADNKGMTPLLHHLDRTCTKDIVKMLYQAGADINAKTNTGISALHFVLRNGNCEVARFLIKKGADYNVVDEKGKSLADIAIEKGYESVLDLMTDIKVLTSPEENDIAMKKGKGVFYRSYGIAAEFQELLNS